MRKYLLLSMFMFLLISAKGQNNLCGGASPFCTGTTYNFPAGVNAGSAQAGANYGCLSTTPNPAWYYMQVLNPGNIEIEMHSTPAHDIDFACWGPFTSPTAPCVAGLTAGSPTPNHHAPGPSTSYPTLNMVDCSYDASPQEWCYIPNAQTGQYYLLLITNYSNQPCNIIFSQTNTGSGSTNCGVLPPVIHNNGPICEGETLKLWADSVPGAQYMWDGPNGFSGSTRVLDIPNATVADAGDYHCLLIMTQGSFYQMSPTDTTTAVVKPKPVLQANNDTICAGQTATIQVTGAASYIWSPGGFTGSTMNSSPATTQNYTIIGTTQGCKDTIQVSMIVNANPVVTITDKVICRGDSAQLVASGANTYLWNTGATTSSITVSPNNTTQYTVVGSTAQNCTSSDTTILIVNPLPSFSVQSTGICLGKNATVNVLTSATTYTYEWDNGYIGNPLVVSPLVTTQYALNVTDTSGCFKKDTIEVAVNPLPHADFTPDPLTAEIENAFITFNNLSTGATQWLWNFGEISSGQNISTVENPTHKYDHKGEFEIWLYVESDKGCRDSTFRTVVIENPFSFYVPNAFSPYSSQLENQIFKPKGIGIDVERYEFYIYNRWGQLIFSTTNIEEGWNGRMKNTGDLLPTGVYVYLIRVAQKYGPDKNVSGTVTLF